MSKNSAVRVKNIHKSFKLPHEKHKSIKSAFVNMLSRNNTYETQHVLKGVSIDIKKGEFVGIVGRNGSGKSTLLKILSGIYEPTKGEVFIDGSLVPFIELGVGFNQELTGRENVYLNGALLGFNREQMNQMYDDIVAFAELEKFMDQKLKNYSSGMQVRLAFSIAIRANSDILILDEVLAVGDANFQKKCFDYFQKLKDDEKTVILVSHDMESVKRYADRAIMIESGEVAYEGTPSEVSEKYTLSNISKEKSVSRNISDQKIIKSVKFVDKAGKVMKNQKTGENLKVKVSYDASGVAGSVLNFGIGMYSSADNYVFGYNTQMDKIVMNKNKGSLVLELANPNILSGEYYINVVCFGANETVPHEFLNKAARILLTTSDISSSYRGVANIEHQWFFS